MTLTRLMIKGKTRGGDRSWIDYWSPGLEDETAIANLADIDPDLILLHVMMPGLDCFQTCCQIKALSKWTLLPNIMVTALDGDENLARCPEAKQTNDSI